MLKCILDENLDLNLESKDLRQSKLSVKPMLQKLNKFFAIVLIPYVQCEW